MNTKEFLTHQFFYGKDIQKWITVFEDQPYNKVPLINQALPLGRESFRGYPIEFLTRKAHMEQFKKMSAWEVVKEVAKKCPTMSRLPYEVRRIAGSVNVSITEEHYGIEKEAFIDCLTKAADHFTRDASHPIDRLIASQTSEHVMPKGYPNVDVYVETYIQGFSEDINLWWSFMSEKNRWLNGVNTPYKVMQTFSKHDNIFDNVRYNLYERVERTGALDYLEPVLDGRFQLFMQKDKPAAFISYMYRDNRTIIAFIDPEIEDISYCKRLPSYLKRYKHLQSMSILEHDKDPIVHEVQEKQT